MYHLFHQTLHLHEETVYHFMFTMLFTIQLVLQMIHFLTKIYMNTVTEIIFKKLHQNTT